MEKAQTEKSPLELTIDWMLNSGIQSEAGGFYAWYDLQEKSHSYLYSEITGYGITTLLFLYSLSKEEIFIRKARQAAEWVIASAIHPCGGVKTRLYPDDEKADKRYSFSGENIFSFDTGMVLYGMINLYAQTEEERFLKTSKLLAEFLLDKMQNKDGSLSPLYDARADKIIKSGDNKWSEEAGGFHSKVCLGLVELFKTTGDNRYLEAALRLCEYALSTQDSSGRFITDRPEGATHLHPHSYAAEGLWYTGASLKVAKFIRSAKKATRWIFEKVSPEGINELYQPSTKGFNNFQRSDILAQALRLGLIFSFTDKTGALKSVLSGYQYAGEDSSQRGGFLFSRGSQHLNSWSSMFALQTSAFYEDKDQIKPGLFI